MDYPLQPPDGWGGARTDLGAGERAASSISDSERKRVWASFERRPVSRAEARALREVRLSRGIRNGAWGAGAGFGGVREPAMGMALLEFSSDGSVSTSPGTAEDNASHVGSVSDNTSAMSVNTVSSSLRRPFSEPTHPQRRGKAPTAGAESNTSSNVSASSSGGHEEPKQPRSRSARPSPPSPEKKDVEVPGYSTEKQQVQCQRRGSTPHEIQRVYAAENNLGSSKTAPGRSSHPTQCHGPGEVGADPMPTPSFPGKSAPPWARDLYQDANEEVLPGGLLPGGVRSGGESSLPSPKNVPLQKQESAIASTSGLGLGLSSESLFRLNGEADADDVLRAMVRLSSTPTTGTGEAHAEKMRPPSHHTSGGARGKRPTASGSRSRGIAPAPPAPSAAPGRIEAGSYGVCRGNTPGIKSGQGRTRNAVGSPSPNSEESMLDVEGRPFQSEARVRRDRLGSSLASERAGAARNGAPVESRNVERSGRKSAPQIGRRRRSSHDKARAAPDGQEVFVLSESRSAPSGVYQWTKQRALSQNIDGGSGDGGGDDAGGRASEESIIQALSSSGLTRQGSKSSLTVSSTNGAPQQPPLSNTNAIIIGFDARSESTDGASDELRRGTASRSEAAAAEGSRGRLRRQQQQRRPQATTKTSAHKKPGQLPVGDTGGGKPLSGSQTKVRINKARVSAGKTSGDRPTARSGKDSYTAVDVVDDGDCDSDVKTSRDLSEIIAGVTRDAAALVVPPRGDSTVDVPPTPAETRQPLSPTEDVLKTADSCSTAAIQQLQTSPSRKEEPLMTPTPGGVRTHSDRVNAAPSGANSTKREDKRRTNNRPEPEAEGRNARGADSGANGPSTAATSRLPGGPSPQDSSKAEKSSLHHPRQPIDVSATERNSATGKRPTSGITDVGTVAEIQANMTPGAGGGREEGSPATDDGTSRAGGLVVGTATLEPKHDRQDIPPRPSGDKGKLRSDERSSQEGKGVLSGSRNRNNGERTTGSGGGSPSSQGSGASSRGSKHGDRNARGGPFPETGQTIFEEDQESGSISRSSNPAEGARTHDDVSGTDTRTGVSLPLLDKSDKPETMAAASGAQQDTRKHSPIVEEDDKPAAMSGPENAVKPQKLPHISGAGGGRSKTAGAAGGTTAQHAIKVRTRPARLESKDLATTTEALTTHHLTVDELLQVCEILMLTYQSVHNPSAQSQHEGSFKCINRRVEETPRLTNRTNS